ncbi:aldo/keto reductase [Lachnospira sp.]|uniref:aldo/keto reductase n=1 Tax=Lachnospira sp. TaxID=2049031 RepID=UPI00257AC83C|nr:aldo/keto reductase [Lachnospira sp.]
MIYKDLILKDGSKLAKLGLGSWNLAMNLSKREEEIEAIRRGISEGINLIDTAEMYGNGASESLIAEAIKGINRNELYLVSKVLPENAGGNRLETSLDASLKRLNTDYLDLYLYHWRGDYPLEETVDKLEEMVKKGKILRWGVSNFDIDDMKELLAIPAGKNCMVNQLLYHLGSRGIEYELLPFLKKEGIPVMAYCPLAQAGSLKDKLVDNPVLKEVASAYDITVMQLLLAFVMRMENVSAIPKAGKISHVIANARVRDIYLSDEDYKRICDEFPAPTSKVRLDVV